MREIFEDILSREPPDPVEAARRNMRPPLKRRFYEEVSIAAEGDGFSVRLDGKAVRTPARHVLAAPSRALAQAIADEWTAQEKVIDPALMPLTRLANTIIDGVSAETGAVAADIEKYLRSDLVCYRASHPESLVVRQAQAWDPVLAWAREALGARFILSEGVTFVTQPEEAIAAARTAIPHHPWRLGAVHVITTLTGSALIALAVASEELSLDAAWAAAHVDEDWNIEHWGRDALALQRRAARLAEMAAAVKVLALVAEAPRACGTTPG